jgi:hypothetical protein
MSNVRTIHSHTFADHSAGIGDHTKDLYTNLLIKANLLPVTPLDAQIFRNKLEAPCEGCLYSGL